jgi:quinohemoprotein ethanol dehydrogenase
MYQGPRSNVVILKISAPLIGVSIFFTPFVASGQNAPAFSAEELLALPTANWITNGGDLYNRRYSPLTEINRDNVSELKGVWRTRLGGSGVGPQYSGEAEPLVYDGVLYIVTGADDTFAIRVETGEILWSYEANLDLAIDTICCGWTNRGLALGDGKVFLGQLDGKLVALDQSTGEVDWSIQAERWQEGYSITSAPRYYEGLVITGFAGAEFGTRGRVKAFDADDGSLVWTFYTVPGPGEIGHDSWPDNEVWEHGGATVWQTPAVDPELGLLYFSTGNPGPDFNGSVRSGDNLFSVSTVAVDVMTGEYRWHYQQVHHDIWDFDSATPVILYDIEIGGRTRKAIASFNKTGWIYLLDRLTGEPLIGIDEVAVGQELRQATAATQPIPRGEPFKPNSIPVPPEGYKLSEMDDVFVPFWEDRALGVRGGANWPPSSYDPARELIFICASDRNYFYEANAEESDDPPGGQRYMGGRFGGAASMPPSGIFTAMDASTNTVAWWQKWPDRCYSGSIATAAGLVFVGRSDGRFMALDSDNGERLWEFQTGAGANATAATFLHDGEQYVAILSAGNVFAGSPRGDSVWLFSLSGNLDPVEPAGNAISDVIGPPVGTPNIENGQLLYAQACVACHGEDGQAGHVAPPITPGLSLGEVVRIIADGRNEMPAFTGVLDSVEARNIAGYVTQDLAP